MRYFEGTPIPTSLLLFGLLMLAGWSDTLRERLWFGLAVIKKKGCFMNSVSGWMGAGMGMWVVLAVLVVLVVVIKSLTRKKR